VEEEFYHVLHLFLVSLAPSGNCLFNLGWGKNEGWDIRLRPDKDGDATRGGNINRGFLILCEE
jgi:hypothetical protein